MRQANTFNVSLTPEFHAYVGEHVATGRFGSASKVVRAALRAFEQQEAAQAGSIPVKPRTAEP